MQAQAEKINPAEKYLLQRPLDPQDSSWQALMEICAIKDTLVSHSESSKLHSKKESIVETN